MAKTRDGYRRAGSGIQTASESKPKVEHPGLGIHRPWCEPHTAAVEANAAPARWITASLSFPRPVLAFRPEAFPRARKRLVHEPPASDHRPVREITNAAAQHFP